MVVKQPGLEPQFSQPTGWGISGKCFLSGLVSLLSHEPSGLQGLQEPLQLQKSKMSFDATFLSLSCAKPCFYTREATGENTELPSAPQTSEG